MAWNITAFFTVAKTAEKITLKMLQASNFEGR